MENSQTKSLVSTDLVMGSSCDHSAEMDGKYLTFWTDSQLFGIAISNVQQIVGIQKITSIPDFPVYFKGVINLRGSIIPVIDVRLRFNKPETIYNERTCIIVINIQQQLFGFIVDAVDEVTHIDEENISMPPDATADETCAYLKGIAKLENKVVLLLDADHMINSSKISNIA